MREWFESLSVREQRLVAAAAIALGVVFLVFFVWQPIAGENRRLSDEVDERARSLAWMGTAVIEIKALESAGQQQVVADDRTLIARVTAELRTDKIEASQIKPEGEDRLRITLTSVPFTSLLPSLERMKSRYGINVEEAVLEPAATKGLVEVRMLLRRGG